MSEQGVIECRDITRAGGAFIKMEGNAVFRRAVATFDNIARETVADLDGHLDDIDWFVPHQANKRIIDASAKKLGIDPAKVVITVERYGNTSAASIPLALVDALEDGRIKQNDVVLLEAMGGGFTWGAVMVRW